MKKRLFIFLPLSILAMVSSIFWFQLMNNNTSLIKKPNILLVTICSLRQDHLGCYGYSRSTSPHIDAFARNATLFNDCYTPIPWTKPAVIALLTGCYPVVPDKIAKGQTLAEWLHANGYETYAAVGTNVVRDIAQMNRGFDIYLDNHDLKTGQDFHTVNADVIVESSISMLRRRKLSSRPLFLWVVFKDPHWKYLPAEPFQKKFLKDVLYTTEHKNILMNVNDNNSIGGVGEAKLKDASGNFITDKAYYISQYDGEIASMDFQLGRLLNYLDHTQHLDDWLVVFVADHGESLGEDNYFFDHGYFISEPLVKIPLIIKFPSQKKQTIRSDTVSIVDIFPTIRNSVTQKRTSRFQEDEGRSLLNKYKRVIFLENSPEHEKNVKLFGCVAGGYKLIWNMATDDKKLYQLKHGKEISIGSIASYQKSVVEKFTKKISNFFSKKDVSVPLVEELKSLGYL